MIYHRAKSQFLRFETSNGHCSKLINEECVTDHFALRVRKQNWYVYAVVIYLRWPVLLIAPIG